MPMRCHSIATALAGGICLFAGQVQAYRTGEDLPELGGAGPVRWQTPEVWVELHDAAPVGVSAVELHNELWMALELWQDTDCALPAFSVRQVSSASAKPGDGLNTIQLIFNGWAARAFSTDEAAVTDVQYLGNEEDGWKIVEADVYLNAEEYSWSGKGEESKSLSAALSHEMGHVLGLLHPCEPDGADGAPKCSKKPDLSDATMHPFYSETGSLHADDIDGLCFLYGEVPVLESDCDADGCDDSDEGTENQSKSEDCSHGPCEGTRLLGDSCQRDRQCRSGACAKAGYCTARCGGDQECGLGKCGADGKCEAEQLPMGAKCTQEDDCLGQACLAGWLEQPVCTRSCDSSEAVCPEGWTCEAVDGRDVCMPAVFPDSCGCRVLGRVRPVESKWGVAVLMGLVIVFAQRRH